MKKISIYLIAIIFLSGCKTFDPKLVNPSGDAFSPKLPALEQSVENNTVMIVNAHGDAIGASPLDINTYFEREVDELMTNPYGATKGYIVLKVSNIETRVAGMGFALLGGFTVCIPFFFGVPMRGAKSSVEVEISVLNMKNELLGKYRGSGYRRFYGSLYNGKLYTDD